MRLELFLVMVLCAACSNPQEQTAQPKTTPAVAITANDDEQRNQFHAEMQAHLDAENFTGLERIARDLNTKKERFPGGDWKLDRFFEAIGGAPGGPDPVKEAVDYKTRITKLTKWTEQMPDSIFANIALADAQKGYAWELRSGKFAPEVSAKQFSDFEQGLKLADETLNRMSNRSKECVAWYTSKQNIGIGLGHDLAEMNRLLEEAMTVEPLYYQIYKEHALYLLPRWHGNPGDWEKFAEQISTRIGGIDGSILYSDICWNMSRYYSGQKFFTENRVYWGAIKKGFTDRKKKYGDSIRFTNAYCLLASAFGDKILVKALLPRIGDRWERDFWIDQKYFDATKKWAYE